MMRTYAGHSTAAKSNELYRANLAKGQTGLSVAFDLPTQTGYDADHELARGEVGKVGVPDRPPRRHAHAARRHPARRDEHVDDDQRDGGLAAGALHRHRRGARRRRRPQLPGTTQNDIIKEFLARGTYAFPPGPVDAADRRHGRLHGRPRSRSGTRSTSARYHLQEAGATPVQEIAYAMSNAIAVLDAVRERVDQELMGAGLRAHLVLRQRRRAVRRGARQAARDGRSCGRSSAASATASRTPSTLRFRYGVQVNSLGLTESQPENNVQRIVLEALAVTLGRDARARAIQLPAWNEALGLPRPWDQQWSLRIQQVLAFETDLLEYPDIFEGSKVMEGLVAELRRGRARRDGGRRRARRRGRGGRRT